jgi:hypothetical protein
MNESTRRNLLRGLGQAIGSGLILTAASAKGVSAVTQIQAEVPKPKLLQQFWLAGFPHYQSMHYLDHCAIEAPLTLIAEPSNRHDARAVVVKHNGIKIGYVPRDQNAAFASLLSRGEALSSKIIEKNIAKPWQPLLIAVYF